MKHLVIIGTGMAGVTAAQTARRLHSQDELTITLVGREKPPSYSRPRLPEVLAGDIREDELIFRTEDWFARQQIDLRCPAEATRIDRLEKKVFYRPLNHGNATKPTSEAAETALSYDALILATGSVTFAPVMPEAGTAAAGSVFALRTLDDVRAIRQHLTVARKTAAVLGGGLLGLEAARALKSAGVERVHVLEASGYLLNRQLNRTASEMLRLYLEREEGLIIHTGVQVDTNGLKTRSVSEVLKSVCGDGVQTLLYSMGVRSQTGLARDAELECGKGIVINQETATSDPAIFAAGDCAEFQGISWGIIPAAVEQGEKAGQFAAAALFPAPNASPPGIARFRPGIVRFRPEPYRQTVPSTTITVGRREAASTGKAVLTAEEENSGRWKNHEVNFKTKGGVKQNDLYVNLVEDTETGTVAGGLVFGPATSDSGSASQDSGPASSNADIVSQWFVRLKQLVGTNWEKAEQEVRNDATGN